MALNVGKEVAALGRMTTRQLRDRYAVVFGEATAANNKPWLVRRLAWRLAWRLQADADAEGGLGERAVARAAELARDADLRLTPPRERTAEVLPTPPVSDPRVPPAGTVLARRYKGGMVQVKVLADGFEYAGEVYGSISAVAKAITGSHCNGFLFFRLTGGKA
jgi:hypothetical protein